MFVWLSRKVFITNCSTAKKISTFPFCHVSYFKNVILCKNFFFFCYFFILLINDKLASFTILRASFTNHRLEMFTLILLKYIYDVVAAKIPPTMEKKNQLTNHYIKLEFPFFPSIVWHMKYAFNFLMLSTLQIISSTIQ